MNCKNVMFTSAPWFGVLVKFLSLCAFFTLFFFLSLIIIFMARPLLQSTPGLGREKEMATHSSVLTWRNPVDRGAWRAAVHGVSQSQTRLKRLSMHACIGEENGNLLQCSCLENPRDGGAWWAAVYGVAQSRTGLK